MQINDTTIVSIDKEALLQQDVFLSLLEVQEPEERARLSALLELRAKEMGLQKEFKTVLKAYIQADEELAKEWKRANAKKRARIDLDFDGNGRPLASINNFLQSSRRMILRFRMNIDGISLSQITQKKSNMGIGMLNHQMNI